MNDSENRGFLQKNVVWIVVLVAVIIFGFLLFKGWDKVVNEQVDSMVTITGNFSCLPVKGGETSETECNLGIRSRDGSHYALDISRIQDANTDLKAEDTIAVTGTLRDASNVEGKDWSNYDIAGVIKVNTMLRTR